MITIKGVHIRNFRSIRDTSIENLGNFSVLVGTNNSGKSNILRALNLFFSDKNEIEPGVPFDLVRDYYRAIEAKKRQVDVIVDFELSDRFKFRSGLEDVHAKLGSKFSVSKHWEAKKGPIITIFDADGNEKKVESDIAVRFIDLIQFRYIPNRILPSHLIETELPKLRHALRGRLTLSDVQALNSSLQKMDEVASTLTSGLNADFKQFLPNADISLTVPRALDKLIFALNFLVHEQDTTTSDFEQGSGIQSILMYEILRLIDGDVSRKFGWQQASIWAVEEPESSLNAGLECRLAHYLSNVSKDPHGRFQIIATTHSDYMIQYAENHYHVQRKRFAGDKIKSTAEKINPAQMRKIAMQGGVSVLVGNLAFYKPTKKIVIVDGKSDKLFINRAFELLGLGQNDGYEILCLEDLPYLDDVGGQNSILEHLRHASPDFNYRDTNHPFFVILDWESELLSKFENISPNKIIPLRWPDADANPKMGSSFTGIERFFPERLIRMADGASAVGSTSEGRLIIHPKAYGSLKTNLIPLIQTELKLDDLRYSKKFLQELHAKLVSRSSE